VSQANSHVADRVASIVVRRRWHRNAALPRARPLRHLSQIEIKPAYAGTKVPEKDPRAFPRDAAAEGDMRKSIRGLGQANLLRVFDIARSILSVLTSFLLASSLASAQNGYPAPRRSEQFTFVQLLADKDPRDIENERSDAYGQFTYLSSWKPPFYAPYTNLNGGANSLLPAADRSLTGTATLDLGVGLWRGAEEYLVPELIRERPLSQLRRLGGAIQNFEFQKGGTTTPQVYVPTASESTEPAKSDDTALGLMDHLSKTGHHDVSNETWNLYGQLTTIGFYKPSFHASYTDLNGSNSSLKPIAETSFTQTLTFFFGLRLRPGTELYVVPEEISETTLSNLKGLGGATENFELQKVGALTPALYRARLFVRQTFGFGGRSIELPSGQMQLGENVDSRRLVFTLGNFSALDVFDKNNVIGDLRKSFFDEAFMTYPAWDFPADARGYSVGAAAELYWDQWAVRLMRLMPPVEPNQQSLNLQPFKYYGDQLEIEHDHMLFGDQPGAVRLLLYRNHEFMGRFADAINAFEANPADNAANCGNLYNYGSENATAPDLCFVRKTDVKLGIGVNGEQSITPNIGMFFRAMYSDGHSEVEAYDSADRSASIGTLAKGTLWGQPLDSAGLGFGTSWISPMHARYLRMGGVDGFIGDGALTQANENMTEIFYSRHIARSIYLSFDYQRVWNPGYNAVRGPVNLFGGKFHVEF
jgi:high affinity Mn2+ porin